MTVSLALLITAGVLIGCGVYLIMDRTLTRILIGLALAGNGVNVFMVAQAGRAGAPPLIDETTGAVMTDALPQAMTLTAIVITLGTTAFGLALAYRSWRLVGHDEVADDVEDHRLALRAKLRRQGERIADAGSDAEARVALDDLIDADGGTA
ncbi:Na(+)/H(+) antiporter subunit C [Nanchangia anserum]|uniref:Na(+)/H(+) antiporter subunit C n=1 Tax=Nanchangia anserum TaxID=2692125 RepID=A0A8I0KVT2_9ACTO|nr:Na(+)/H(+) antiporter subunit C [Nanchangia anserum]MBD3689274.1 Na(+)/H(+) antiporter subunit C [Nanchangia anserum]QOX81493.1 Na(+)/H(+) antiporter subunit C [Nanchangia anserum]